MTKDKTPAVDPQQVVDQETAQGFRGVEVDSTPNQAYTLQGQADGAPTPETDPEQAEHVRLDAKDAERKANGVAER
jgi:hypothetical protein